MKSYVINMERAKNRKNSIEKEFEFYDIQFEFFPGVDWKELSEKEIIKYTDSAYKGELGCWLSHRNIWKTAIKNGEQVIAVFEDDAKLTPETKLALDSLRSSIGYWQYDIVFLYHGRPRNPLVPAYKINECFTLNLVKYNSMGTVGYVITQPAMLALLDKFPLMNKPIDVQMHFYWVHGLKTYILTPQVVFHGESDQTNHSYTRELMMGDQERLPNKSKYKVIREFNNFRKKQLPKYIPQLIAFRKRVKNEIIGTK